MIVCVCVLGLVSGDCRDDLRAPWSKCKYGYHVYEEDMRRGMVGPDPPDITTIMCSAKGKPVFGCIMDLGLQCPVLMHDISHPGIVSPVQVKAMGGLDMMCAILGGVSGASTGPRDSTVAPSQAASGASSKPTSGVPSPNSGSATPASRQAVSVILVLATSVILLFL